MASAWDASWSTRGKATATVSSTTAHSRRRCCGRSAASFASQASSVRIIPSCLLRRLDAKQTGGPEDQQRNQNGENKHIGPAHLKQLAAERLDQADQQSTQDGPRDVADATEHRRGKGPQAGSVANVKARKTVVETKEEPACAGQ